MTTLHALLREIIEDRAARDHFQTDPEGFLAARGWATLDPADVDDAMAELDHIEPAAQSALLLEEPVIAGEQTPETWDFAPVAPRTVAIDDSWRDASAMAAGSQDPAAPLENDDLDAIGDMNNNGIADPQDQADWIDDGARHDEDNFETEDTDGQFGDGFDPPADSADGL